MNNNSIGFIDALSVASFFLGIQNYGLNLTQNDKQELLEDLHTSLKKMVVDVHDHLQKQDQKIDDMYRMINEIYKKNK